MRGIGVMGMVLLVRAISTVLRTEQVGLTVIFQEKYGTPML